MCIKRAARSCIELSQPALGIRIPKLISCERKKPQSFIQSMFSPEFFYFFICFVLTRWLIQDHPYKMLTHLQQPRHREAVPSPTISSLIDHRLSLIPVHIYTPECTELTDKEPRSPLPIRLYFQQVGTWIWTSNQGQQLTCVYSAPANPLPDSYEALLLSFTCKRNLSISYAGREQ